MSHPYRPRDHDHLVEPMFAGLGLEGGQEQDKVPGAMQGGWLRRVWRAFLRLVRPSRSGSGR